jgi:hypothetical protein
MKNKEVDPKLVIKTEPRMVSESFNKSDGFDIDEDISTRMGC